MKFVCPSCGKRTDKLIEGLCPSCFLEKNPIFFETNKNIKKCVICGRYFIANKRGTLDKLLNTIIRTVLKQNRSYVLKEITILDYRECENKIYINFKVLAAYNDYMFEETYNLEVDVKEFVCNDCSRRKTGYYEAILQIRSKTRKDIEKYIDRIVKIIENQGVYITKWDFRDEGIDLYLDNSKKTRIIIDKIKKIYNSVEIKISRKLHTQDRQTSKKIYKMTVLVRFLE